MAKHMDTYKLSKRGEIDNSSIDTPMGEIKICTTGNDGDLQMEKPGSGLTPEPEMINDFQDNIRDRFALDNNNDDDDSVDY